MSTAQLVSEVAAAVAAAAALGTIGVGVWFGRDTARKLASAGREQERTIELLVNVAQSLEGTVSVVTEAAAQAESNREREFQRWQEANRPRLVCSVVGAPTRDGIRIKVHNAGGPATPACVIASSGGTTYGGTVQLPQQLTNLELTMTGTVNGLTLPPGAVRVAARDSSGTWWDQELGGALAGPGPDASGDQIVAWWVQQVFDSQPNVPGDSD